MRLIHVKASQNHMATTFHFVVSCEQRLESAASAVLYEAHRTVARLERELSEFLPSSPVFKLNHAEVGSKVRFNPNAYRLLMRSMELGKRTGGAFNCLAKSRGERPSLRWEEATLEVWRHTAGTHLGFGAIGKGFALDQVRAILEANGFTDFLLSAGGSSVVLAGFAFPAEPWRWGWSWERRGGEPHGTSFEHCSGKTIAIGISGIQEQGQHIMGASPSPAVSALYAGEVGLEADALSTAFFVGGWEKEFVLKDPLRAHPALGTIDGEGVLRWNETFERLWGPAA